MKVTHSIQSRHVELRFDGKPSAAVRSTLKGNGFRWSPSSGAWWRGHVGNAADVICAVQGQIDREAGIRPAPIGKCRSCGSDNGYVHSYGAQTHVECDTCWPVKLAALTGGYGSCPDVDALYEDQCQQTCGL